MSCLFNGVTHYITNSFCKNVIKILAPYPMLWTELFYKFFLLLSGYIYCTMHKKYTVKIIHTITCILIHYSVYVLNLMLLAHSWNFAKFPTPHKRLGRPVLRFKFLLLPRMKDLGSCVFFLIVYSSDLPTLHCVSICVGCSSWYILGITNDITNRR
jgi:hypothetical protein